jgi:hypothetical protein
MRPKKEPRESFGSTLRKDIMNDLRELSDDTGTPISKLLDQAVTLLLEKQGMPRDKNERNQDKMYIDINMDK